MRERTRNILIILFIILIIIFWSILLSYISPQEIISKVGVNNAYWIIFLISSLAGVSSLTSTSYYASIITFAAGGANPFLLALFAGAGMTIGDSLFYFLGRNGDKVLPEKIDRHVNRMEDWIKKKPIWLQRLVIYIYTGFTPLPGDFLSIFLGITNFKYKFIVWPILAGNTTLMLILALLAQNGIGPF